MKLLNTKQGVKSMIEKLEVSYGYYTIIVYPDARVTVYDGIIGKHVIGGKLGTNNQDEALTKARRYIDSITGKVQS